MRGDEYMRHIVNVRREIRLLMEQIERDETIAAGVKAIRYDFDKVQTSPQDILPEIIANIVITTEKLYNRIETLQKLEEAARGVLLQLKEKHERVLVLHYLNNMTWERIAKELSYDEKYIYEVKDAALDELTEVLQSSEKI